MSTTIETVFENGVFRPLKPIAIREHQRVTIQIDEAGLGLNGMPSHPRLEPREYPDDYLESPDSELEYVPVPPKAVTTIRANFVFAGPIQPRPYPED
jgi:predicted DNA-binding antitoxin AbrB/MazE fold protein